MTTTVKTLAKKATKSESNGTAKTVSKPEKSSTVVKPAIPQSVGTTLEERIQHVDELKALVDRRQIFVKKRAHIRQFQFGADEHSAELTIADRSGREFTTGNGHVIKILVDGLEKIISKKVAELDTEIMSFQV